VDLGESALHIAAAEAAGAHVHPTGRTVHHNANALHIGSPDAMALAVGMADVVTVQRALFANLTILTHGNPPPYWSVTHQAYLQYHNGKEKARVFFRDHAEKKRVFEARRRNDKNHRNWSVSQVFGLVAWVVVDWNNVRQTLLANAHWSLAELYCQ
jgi:hypothetical protein